MVIWPKMRAIQRAYRKAEAPALQIGIGWRWRISGALDNSGGYHGESGEGYNDNVDGGGDASYGDECGNKMMEMMMVFIIR